MSVGVTVEDQYGNTITTGNTGSTDTIHVALSSGSFAAGTTSVAASNGVASFSGLQINAAASYTITAIDTTHGSGDGCDHELLHREPGRRRTSWPSPRSPPPSPPAAERLSA